MSNKLTFVAIFPEYADKISEESTYSSPEYILYRYLLGENKSLTRLASAKVLLNAPETFYAKDIIEEEKSRGGIMRGFYKGGLVEKTGTEIKYYLEIPDDNKAIICYSKEWKLSIPKDRMILAYNRIRNEILKII